MITRLFLVCLGGAVGTGARYLTAVWAAGRFGVSFPVGTVLVNVLGSFLIGVLMQLSLATDLRFMLTTGLMGGFTTYSAFNYETTMYVRSGAWTMAFVNVGATLIGCLLAGFAGLAIGRLLAR